MRVMTRRRRFTAALLMAAALVSIRVRRVSVGWGHYWTVELAPPWDR